MKSIWDLLTRFNTTANMIRFERIKTLLPEVAKPGRTVRKKTSRGGFNFKFKLGSETASVYLTILDWNVDKRENPEQANPDRYGFTSVALYRGHNLAPENTEFWVRGNRSTVIDAYDAGVLAPVPTQFIADCVASRSNPPADIAAAVHERSWFLPSGELNPDFRVCFPVLVNLTLSKLPLFEHGASDYAVDNVLSPNTAYVAMKDELIAVEKQLARWRQQLAHGRQFLLAEYSNYDAVAERFGKAFASIVGMKEAKEAPVQDATTAEHVEIQEPMYAFTMSDVKKEAMIEELEGLRTKNGRKYVYNPQRLATVAMLVEALVRRRDLLRTQIAPFEYGLLERWHRNGISSGAIGTRTITLECKFEARSIRV